MIRRTVGALCVLSIVSACSSSVAPSADAGNGCLRYSADAVLSWREPPGFSNDPLIVDQDACVGYTTDPVRGAVVRLDFRMGTFGQEMGSVLVGAGARGLTRSADGSTLYVATDAPQQLATVDLRTFSAGVPLQLTFVDPPAGTIPPPALVVHLGSDQLVVEFERMDDSGTVRGFPSVVDIATGSVRFWPVPVEQYPLWSTNFTESRDGSTVAITTATTQLTTAVVTSLPGAAFVSRIGNAFATTAIFTDDVDALGHPCLGTDGTLLFLGADTLDLAHPRPLYAAAPRECRFVGDPLQRWVWDYGGGFPGFDIFDRQMHQAVVFDQLEIREEARDNFWPVGGDHFALFFTAGPPRHLYLRPLPPVPG